MANERQPGDGEDVDVRRLSAEEADRLDPTEDEIRIPIVEEELVIEKRPVVREVLVIRKRVVTETREVEADLRKERIEVEGDVARQDGRE